MEEQQEQEIYSGLCFCGQDTVADPDLELRGVGGGGSFDLLALLAFLPSVISSFFTQYKKGGGGGLL